MVIDQLTKQIICTAYGKGREHDFHLFKTSFVKMLTHVECLADKGYQGMTRLHSNSHTPEKKPRRGVLSSEQQLSNQRLAKRRVVIEHINRLLKIFRILSERYRNRRRRFGLRFNLIAGLYNYDLALAN
ncbi:IS5 family transposase [Spirochaetia bacterium]|nr:IS5 family transposase [Spirochaetia bacterium]